MRAKYLKGKQFIHATKHLGGSYTWRSFLSSQRLVATGIAKMVINGRLTSFWHDKWLLDRPLVSFCQFSIPLHLNSVSIRDVWCKGNWRREVFDFLHLV